MTALDGYVFETLSPGSNGSRRRGYTAALRDGVDPGPEDVFADTRSVPSATAALRDGTATETGGGPPPPVTTYYQLAAIDTGVGRRFWTSTTLNFVSAPPPVGAWITASLTVLSSWQ